MNDSTIAVPNHTLTIGAPHGGGFFAGRFHIGDDLFALVVAPKASGEHEDVRWNKTVKRVDGALSVNDGYTNTNAMAEAGSALATWARSLRVNDYDDWYLPGRDELELLYRHFKPGTRENLGYRSGDNPSSAPPGFPYTDSAPGQTSVYSFRKDGPEAFDEVWYWTSTQVAFAGLAEYAWSQGFDDGYQYDYHKGSKLRARAVRRNPI